MKKHLTLALGLAITLLACEDKEKKQTPAETQTAEPAAAAETQEATQEAAALPPTTLTDSRDSKTYKTVKIGNQTWMAENLNYETKEGSMCYDNKPANCQTYGRLYNWNTAIKACPSGWHLPSKDEWQTLENFVGDENGKKLKAKSGWNDNGNGTDEYGFSALPGGSFVDECADVCESSGFLDVGDFGYWWSATNGGTYGAYFRRMQSFNESVMDYDNFESSLLSVRCIKN